MHRYVERAELLDKMSRLAREELRHFEQVLKLMRSRKIDYAPLTASRYAQGLHKGVRKQEPGRLVDTLIVGALIEARSCERFARLAPYLAPELKAFYESLLKSEARHFNDYLTLAKPLCDAQMFEKRLAYFRGLEADLVQSPDAEFRFHSGPPSGVNGSD
jgi:tRNA-(ms[2]io[6]A)-hydroxylase